MVTSDWVDETEFSTVLCTVQLVLELAELGRKA
jgi:hypothetical protein